MRCAAHMDQAGMRIPSSPGLYSLQLTVFDGFKIVGTLEVVTFRMLWVW